MTYTDAQGRPELVAQPFISRGTATYRIVSTPTSENAEPDDATGDQAPPSDTEEPER